MVDYELLEGYSLGYVVFHDWCDGGWSSGAGIGQVKNKCGDIVNVNVT